MGGLSADREYKLAAAHSSAALCIREFSTMSFHGAYTYHTISDDTQFSHCYVYWIIIIKHFLFILVHRNFSLSLNTKWRFELNRRWVRLSSPMNDNAYQRPLYDRPLRLQSLTHVFVWTVSKASIYHFVNWKQC